MDMGAAVGGFLGLVVLYALGDILVGVPGLFIYSALFTSREYDPDNTHDIDINSMPVRLTGIAFWALVAGGAYGIYRLTA